MSSANPGRNLGALLQVVAAAACWGTATTISKAATSELHPLALFVVQLVVSLTLVATVARLRGLPLRTEDARAVGRFGLLNPGFGFALCLLGLATIPASLSVLIWAGEPLVILGLAVLVLGERVGPGIAALFVLAVGGLGLVLYDPAASGELVGIVLTVAGTAIGAFYTVAMRRHLPAERALASVLVAQQLHGLALALVLAGLALVAGVTLVPGGLTPAGLVAAALSGALSFGLGYLFYLGGLRHLPASRAAAVVYLVPVFGVASASLLGERLSPVQWLGALVVTVAVGAISVRRIGAAAATA